ncbi:MAG: sialidase family protein [Candidatus Hydrogenedentes bacterium]|nr:sialidase family protein [Candidatus Hydrogenedentota bacterium]
MKTETNPPAFVAVCLVTMACVLLIGAAERDDVKQAVVFTAGADGYHSYRIPAIITTLNGTLVAFCEGRRESTSDFGDIDLVLKRSFDKGKTWQPLQLVIDDGTYSCNNPAPVVDKETGAIVLVFSKHPGDDTESEILGGAAQPCTVWVSRSADDGATWSAPNEISQQVSQPDWRWYAVGPGHGIQQHNGRLLIPSNHSLLPDPSTWFSHVIASDDNGITWNALGSAGGYCNESTLVVLPDGALALNMRSYHKQNRRHVALSNDGGAMWSKPEPVSALVEPVCQASSLRVDLEGGPPLYLFSNPASTKRERMSVRISHDACATWSNGIVLHEGPSAYSDLTELSDGTIGCLYERGEKTPYESIYFAHFRLHWLDR